MDKNKELLDLKDFMQTLKNSNTRVVGDMVPLNYDKKTNWEMLSNAIIDPETDDGKLCWNEITNFKNGQTHERIFGYQYDYGTFPIIFKA